MERMLVLLDGSENAEQVLPYVQALGQKMSMPVTLMRVCEAGEAEDKSYLSKLAERFVGRGIDTTVQTLEAHGHKKVSQTVLDYASREHAHMIALVTHGRSGINREVCGTTGREILTHCTIPVMMVRTQNAPHRNGEIAIPDGILVTLDGSKLAEQALPFGEKLARGMKGKLILMRVAEPAYKVNPAGDLGAARSATEVETEARLLVTDYLTETAEKIRGRDVTKVKLDIQLGQPADTIVRRAGAGDVGLVVMSTHGRTGLARVLFGSVAGYVLSHSPVPVVIVRPQ